MKVGALWKPATSELSKGSCRISYSDDSTLFAVIQNWVSSMQNELTKANRRVISNILISIFNKFKFLICYFNTAVTYKRIKLW